MLWSRTLAVLGTSVLWWGKAAPLQFTWKTTRSQKSEKLESPDSQTSAFIGPQGPKPALGYPVSVALAGARPLGPFMKVWHISSPFGNQIGGKFKNLARFWRAQSAALCFVFLCFCFQLHFSNHTHEKTRCYSLVLLSEWVLKTCVPLKVSPSYFLLQFKMQTTLKNGFTKPTNLYG